MSAVEVAAAALDAMPPDPRPSQLVNRDRARLVIDALKAAGYELVLRDQLTSMLKACNENAEDAARVKGAHCEEMFYRGQAVGYSVILDGSLESYRQVLSANTAEAQS